VKRLIPVTQPDTTEMSRKLEKKNGDKEERCKAEKRD
jgi:hypothetical protein